MEIIIKKRVESKIIRSKKEKRVEHGKKNHPFLFFCFLFFSFFLLMI